MKVARIKDAQREAAAFLMAIVGVERTTSIAVWQRGEWITGTKETGALRRASMELTRALSAMRSSK